MPDSEVIIKSWVEDRPRPMPQGMFDPMPSVWVKYNTERIEKLIKSFFPDEVNYVDNELVGLTRDEALQNHCNKDKKYLQS